SLLLRHRFLDSLQQPPHLDAEGLGEFLQRGDRRDLRLRFDLGEVDAMDADPLGQLLLRPALLLPVPLDRHPESLRRHIVPLQATKSKPYSNSRSAASSSRRTSASLPARASAWRRRLRPARHRPEQACLLPTLKRSPATRAR